MATAEERIAYLEGHVSGYPVAFADLRDSLARVDGSVVRLEQRMDARFATIDARLMAIDARFDAVNTKIDSLADKMGRQFVWLVGFQITTLVAIVGALLARS